MTTTSKRLSQKIVNDFTKHALSKLIGAIKAADKDLVLYWYDVNMILFDKVSIKVIPQDVLDVMLEARVLISIEFPRAALYRDHLKLVKAANFEIFCSEYSTVEKGNDIAEIIYKWENHHAKKVTHWSLLEEIEPAEICSPASPVDRESSEPEFPF